MSRVRILGAVIVLVMAVVFLAIEQLSSSQQKLRSVTSLSDGPTGLSIFYELAQRTATNDIFQRKTALLGAADLQGVGLVVIASPLASISDREGAILREYVEKGGLLVLSFHDAGTYAALRTLFKRLDIQAQITNDEEFVNSTSRTVKVTQEGGLIPKESRLAVYSSTLFDLPSCSINRVTCYLIERNIGAGAVLIFNGIIPLANALIGKEGNGAIAQGLLTKAHGTILIDEYRHLFHEKSLKDLLLDLRVVLPLLMLFLGALTFFLLGDRDDAPHERLFADHDRIPVYHDFSRRVFVGNLSGMAGLWQAREFNVQCLKELFPGREREIDAVVDRRNKRAGEDLRSLLRLHQKWSREREVLRG